MVSLTRVFALSVIVLGCCAASAVADGELEKIKQSVIKQWSTHRAVQAKFTTDGGTEAQGNKATQHAEGTYELVRKGETSLYRHEVKQTMDLQVGSQNVKFESTIVTVCDGKYAYKVTQQSGQTTAVKTKADTRTVCDPMAIFNYLGGAFELKVLPEEAVNGADAYVIEAIPQGTRPGMSHTVYYFGKEHGTLLKLIEKDRNGKAALTTVYSDIQHDVKPPADRFQFTPPKGVVVNDLTGD